jgi:hypothetical protein
LETIVLLFLDIQIPSIWGVSVPFSQRSTLPLLVGESFWLASGIEKHILPVGYKLAVNDNADDL